MQCVRSSQPVSICAFYLNMQFPFFYHFLCFRPYGISGTSSEDLKCWYKCTECGFHCFSLSIQEMRWFNFIGLWVPWNVFRNGQWIFLKCCMCSHKIGWKNRFKKISVWKSHILLSTCLHVQILLFSHELHMLLINVLLLLTRSSCECCLPSIMGDIYVPFFPSPPTLIPQPPRDCSNLASFSACDKAPIQFGGSIKLPKLKPRRCC
jgi:hypothetical protein